ncbi:hypothetical protein [Gelidibacter salicanalis]|uniref:Uncharacterized protein n=1 Tax=Gelidibacter salicanalis TaxID=291193 RepID=A0A934NHY5_9FLAO|nr:hypothetical protein [Gelidibacter salicanalis]MBJ7881401.1 hypothetical protein [Gelidibacter salicanalis]
MKKRKMTTTVSAIILAVFAVLTLFLSSAVIFDWFGIRAKEGNYVLFIVWANFTCSLLYLIAVYGFFKSRKWTFWVLLAALAVLIIAFTRFLLHIDNGGLYEEKTIGAMIFRMLVTLIFLLIALRNFNLLSWRN